jgi:hypothetical protein
MKKSGGHKVGVYRARCAMSDAVVYGAVPGAAFQPKAGTAFYFGGHVTG